MNVEINMVMGKDRKVDLLHTYCTCHVNFSMEANPNDINWEEIEVIMMDVKGNIVMD